MMKNKISPLQFSCLICFPILALFSGIGTFNVIKYGKVDAYLSVVMSYFIGFIILGLFIYIFNYKKELDVTSKIKHLFGPILGLIINYMISILMLFIGVFLLYNISNFAISQFLSQTPLLLFFILFGIVIVYAVSSGIENISRVCVIFFGIICILTIISTSGIMPNFESSNIKPFLENGIGVPFKGSLVLTFTNIIPIFALLVIPKDKVINEGKKVNKYLFLFYTIAFIFTFLALFLTIGALGINLSTLFQYPEYTVLKKISLFKFIDRIENFVYIKWVFSSAVCLFLIVYYVSLNIKRDSMRIVPSIVMILMIVISTIIFKNNTIFYNYCCMVFPYINVMLFIIFLIIGINIFIRKRLFKDDVKPN